MKIFEIILLFLFGLGLLFLTLAFPGGSMLSILGLGQLAFFYFLLSFALFNGVRFRDIFKKESFRNVSTMRILGAVAAGMALSTLTIGILFRLMFWPGDSIMLLQGLTTTAIVLIVATVRSLKGFSRFYRRVFLRLGIAMAFGLVLFLTPTETLVNFRYRHNPTYAKALNNSLAYPENEQYKRELQKLQELSTGISHDTDED